MSSKLLKNVWFRVGLAVVILLVLVSLVPSEEKATNQEIVDLATSPATEVPNGESPLGVSQEEESRVSGQYLVVSVTDGDTFKVSINGTTETIRLIGVDTPETVHPTEPVECFGREASNKTKAALTGAFVSFEQDPTQGERDKYGRLLVYTYLSDGTNFNKLLIEEGYAYEYTYNAPYKYQEEFKSAQREAELNKRGLWADGVCEKKQPPPSPVVESKIKPVNTSPSSNTSSYTCSYNAYNCADFATHMQAQNVYEMCGGVSNDVHGLDADKDGKSCESLP